MRYFILLSLLTHGLLLTLWSDVPSFTPDTGHVASSADGEMRIAIAMQPSLNTSISSAITTPNSPRPASPPSNDHLASIIAAPVSPPPAVIQKALEITDDTAHKPLNAENLAPAALATTPSAASSPPPDTPAAEPPTPRISGDTTELDKPVSAQAAVAENLQQKLHQAFTPHFSYPRIAQRRGWQGRVELSLHIAASGKLSNIRVLQSSGHRILDRAAVKSLQQLGSLPEAQKWLTQGYNGTFPVHYQLIDG